jgi:DNA replication protein DnaC
MPSRCIEQLAKWLDKPHNFLIITGPPGVGKTYILSAIVGECYHKFVNIRAFNEREYLGVIRDGINKYTNYDFIKEIYRLTDNDLFIIDDLGSASRTDWRDDIIMETLDWCYSESKPTILTSNYTKQEFYENYHPRICSRLFSKENVILDLEEMPDLRDQGK